MGQTLGDKQDPLIKNQLRLQHDNDFFTLTDRYYSSGLFLNYTRLLQNDLLVGENEQITFSIGQEVYTPSDLNTMEISKQDRPYVGFLALKGGWSLVKKKHGLNVSFLLGVAGKASGAGGFQRWYHNVFVVADPPTWAGEMENSLHVNLYVSYRREWQLAPNPFSISLAVQPELAFGTRDVYAHTELITYFGRRDPFSSSMGYNRIGSTGREIFFSLRAGYRYVGHNALLEGNALGDKSVFLVPANKEIIYAGVDVQHRFGKNEYWVGYRIQSAEANTTESHKYVILSYARNF
ncbi:MAG: lipid A-modifier LpxR family protein [Aquaticitalea sp.]